MATSADPVLGPAAARDLVVSLDYGQFSLHTGYSEPDLAIEVLHEVLNGDGIAQRGPLLVVTSPHQNNFRMPLRIETWHRQPPDDLVDWQEVFEAHLVISEEGLAYGSPTLDFVVLPIEPGSYHVQITGRGFVGHGWPGSSTPSDEWRLRVWPSDGPPEARRTSAKAVTSRRLDS